MKKVLSALAVVVALIAVVTHHWGKSTTPAGAQETTIAWTPRIGRLGVLPGGSYAATSSGAFAAEVEAQAAHNTVRSQQLISAGQIVQLIGRARVRIVDGNLTTLTVRVLAAPDDPGLVAEKLWINPTWVKAP